MASPTLRIEIDGVNQLKRALKVLSDPDLPFIRPALEDAGELLAREAGARAGKIGRAVGFAGLRGGALGTVRAVVEIRHPAGASFEFGRSHYYTGYTGRNQKSGRKVRVSGGMKPRPYLGIKYDTEGGAVAATRDEIGELLSRAFSLEWDRIGLEGD